MLIVDLDRSLIKSDYLIECFVSYFSQNIFAPFFSIFIYLKDGKTGLKKFLYEKACISVKNLPYNQKVIEFIEEWKIAHPSEKVFLVSASDHRAVRDIAEYLGFFDDCYGTIDQNLKAELKLRKIKDLTNNNKFTYIGDSNDDLVIWKNANRCVIINPTRKLAKKLINVNESIEILDNKETSVLKEIFQTLRIHQWTKNTLLFVPAILALKPFFQFFLDLMIGFIAFSFIASAFYILNDLFDIENDRNHPTKKFRSFASGSLSITHGIIIFSLLFISSITLAGTLSDSFQICIAIYGISTFLYSKYLKKIPIIDILTLSFLYLLRVISGGAIVGVTISNWLLTFSVFFFLFLAAVKRWIELKKVNFNLIPGRGYLHTDLSFIGQISYFSGLISVLIICLYIDSQQAQTLYNASKMLWFIPLILLYWILETLFKVERDQVDEDPVKYALKSKTSYVCFLGFLFILMITSAY